MTESEKEVYRKQAEDIEDNPLETMSPRNKRDVVLKIAKRHQADVRLAFLFVSFALKFALNIHFI